MTYHSTEPSLWDLIADLRERHKEFRVKRGRPCVICSSSSWCVNGTVLAFCRRSGGVGAELDRDGNPIEAGEFGFVHRIGSASSEFLAAANQRRLDRAAGILQPGEEVETDTEKDKRWRKELHRWRDGRKRLPELANELGVTVESLLAIGTTHNGSCWVFPERNGRGQVVGMKTRYANGCKDYIPPSSAGLTYPTNVRESSEIFIVEGASDVSAALSGGIMSIGRPNNCTGAAMIAMLLKDWTGLPIVIGENDWRIPREVPGMPPHPLDCPGCQRCWPGKWGAEKVASELLATLPRTIVWMPPVGRKDIREWLLYHPGASSRDVMEAFQYGIA